MLEQTIDWMSKNGRVPSRTNDNKFCWFPSSIYKTSNELPDRIYEGLLSKTKFYETLKAAIDDLGQVLAKLGLISVPNEAKPLPSFEEWCRASQCSPGYCNRYYYFISECSPSFRVDPSARLSDEVFNALKGIEYNFTCDYNYCGGHKLSIINGKCYYSKKDAMKDLKQTLRNLGIISTEPSPDAEDWRMKHGKSLWRIH